MEVFSRFIAWTAQLPDVLSLLLCPILFLVCALLLVLWKKRGAIKYFSLLFGGVGAFLVGCKGVEYALPWAALYLALYGVIALLLRIPRRKKQNKSKEDLLYEKFYIPLGEEEAPRDLPPKVNCFPEETEGVGAEESGVCLAHVSALLTRLQGAKLSATDRLETDVIARTLQTYRYKKLNGEELRTLNDCLATVLRLTAKYAL